MLHSSRTSVFQFNNNSSDYRSRPTVQFPNDKPTLMSGRTFE